MLNQNVNNELANGDSNEENIFIEEINSKCYKETRIIVTQLNNSEIANQSLLEKD